MSTALKLTTILLALATIAPAGVKAAQPDLNMDDLRTFSRRFCLKTGACTQRLWPAVAEGEGRLHPNIEDRRENDTSLAVPHAASIWDMPVVPVDPNQRGAVSRGAASGCNALVMSFGNCAIRKPADIDLGYGSLR